MRRKKSDIIGFGEALIAKARARAEVSDLAVGARLRVVREAAGLSQRAHAKLAGVTNSTVSLIEQESHAPSICASLAVSGATRSCNCSSSDTGRARGPAQSRSYTTGKRPRSLFRAPLRLRRRAKSTASRKVAATSCSGAFLIASATPAKRLPSLLAPAHHRLFEAGVRGGVHDAGGLAAGAVSRRFRLRIYYTSRGNLRDEVSAVPPKPQAAVEFSCPGRQRDLTSLAGGLRFGTCRKWPINRTPIKRGSRQATVHSTIVSSRRMNIEKVFGRPSDEPMMLNRSSINSSLAPVDDISRMTTLTEAASWVAEQVARDEARPPLRPALFVGAATQQRSHSPRRAKCRLKSLTG